VSETLRKRVLTAVVLAVALLVVLLALPAVATVVVITTIVLLGAWEWSAFLQLPSAALRAAYVGLVGLLLFGAWSFSVTSAGRDIVMLIALAWWLIALLWIALAPRRTTGRPVAGESALVPAWLALIRMRVVLPDGAQWVLFALVLVWVADIGAYFCGRRFGRVRLAPQVSPAKTWEGVFGAMLLSALVAIAGAAWFHLPLGTFLALCLGVVGFSIIGDLTESLLKRYAGVKDSGTLFPGHGGVMDRIDSITGAAPVLFLGLTYLGVAK
jgi:phosphatidate cytidylyltransferase